MTGKGPTMRKRGHSSLDYFHLVGDERVRASLADPDLPDRLTNAARWAHLPLRDRLIMHIAWGYGASIRDILRLTIGDWRAEECQLELRVRQQMSRGQGVRVLRLGPNTQSLLRAFVQGERKEHDPEHRELSQLAATEPLFLTAEGCAYGYRAFLPQWETVCHEAGISLPPHGLRHWFVILMLRQIEERTHDPGQQQVSKAALIRYMGWQNPKTLRAYEIEYHREIFIRESDELLEELFANRPLYLNEQRSEIERREELDFWPDY